MTPDMTACFRIVELNAVPGKVRVLAYARDQSEAEYLCDLHFGRLTVSQVQ